MQVRDVVTIVNDAGTEYEATVLAIAANDVLVSVHNSVVPKCWYVDKSFVKGVTAWRIK